jgi:hypothetical protein
MLLSSFLLEQGNFGDFHSTGWDAGLGVRGRNEYGMLAGRPPKKVVIWKTDKDIEFIEQDES